MAGVWKERQPLSDKVKDSVSFRSSSGTKNPVREASCRKKGKVTPVEEWGTVILGHKNARKSENSFRMCRSRQNTPRTLAVSSTQPIMANVVCWGACYFPLFCFALCFRVPALCVTPQ